MRAGPYPPQMSRWCLVLVLAGGIALTVVACVRADAEGDDPGECADGADNDEDGLYDCSDPDCQGHAPCLSDDDDATAADDDDSAAVDDDDSASGDDDSGAGDDDSALACAPCAGDFTLSSQEGFDELASCASLSGSLHIEDAPDSFKGQLDCLVEIGEDLRIEANLELTSLSFLSGLLAIDDDLIIEDNDALEDISGLSSLVTVGGDMRVEDNNLLVSVAGLQSLVSVGDDVYLWDNDLLPEFSGLTSLAQVGGGLFISGNDGLLHLDGLAALDSLGADLSITSNRGLISVAGLTGMSTFGGDLTITDNDVLCQEDAQALAASLPVSGTVLVLGNDGVCP